MITLYLYSTFFIYSRIKDPDGDRTWRKTMSGYEDPINLCFGADCNRNFGFHWGGLLRSYRFYEQNTSITRSNRAYVTVYYNL